MDSVIRDMKSHIAWCNEYIAWYSANHTYDPFKALSEQESKEQEMFTLCINYLHGIESALFSSNRMFEAQRNSIAYRERSEQA